MHVRLSSTRCSPALVLLGVLATPLLAACQTPEVAAIFVDGQAQVVPAFADTAQWIRHDLWVETEVDTDVKRRLVEQTLELIPAVPCRWRVLYRLYLGVADGRSIVRVLTCRYSK